MVTLARLLGCQPLAVDSGARTLTFTAESTLA